MNIINQNIKTKIIKEDQNLNYIFLNEDNYNIDETIEVLENVNLNFLIGDFKASNKDINLIFNLHRNAHVYVDVISISRLSFIKKFHICINHLEENSYSRCKMIGINDDNATLIFKGDSFIKNGAKYSDTIQETRITNLSFDCKSEASPGLYIKENDVKASHKASLGSYNENDIYYLLSRGLTLKESKLLISNGQLYPIISKIDDESVKKNIELTIKEILK